MRLRNPIFQGAISTKSTYRQRTQRQNIDNQIQDISQIYNPTTTYNSRLEESSGAAVNISKFLRRNLPEGHSTTKVMNSSYLYQMTEPSEEKKTNNTHRLRMGRSGRGIDNDIENTDPNQKDQFEYRRSLNKLMQRDASHRLEISRLKTGVHELYRQNMELKQKLHQAEVRESRDSEYILKLDNEVRHLKQELTKLRKAKGNQKLSELQQQNKGLRFVIQELTRQTQNQQQKSSQAKKHVKNKSVQSDAQSTNRTKTAFNHGGPRSGTKLSSTSYLTSKQDSKQSYNQIEANQSMESSSWDFVHEARSSSQKPQLKETSQVEISPFQWTMNPKDRQSSTPVKEGQDHMDRVMTREQLLNLIQDPDFRDALDDPTNSALKHRVLEIIRQDYSGQKRQQSMTYTSDDTFQDRSRSGDFGTESGFFGSITSKPN